MSIIARWHVTALFGRKAELLEQVDWWINTVAAKAGSFKKVRLLTGSIGAKESQLQLEFTFDSISDLDLFFVKIADQGPLHQKWGKETSQFVVHGSNKWHVLRVVPLNLGKDFADELGEGGREMAHIVE